MKKILEEYGAIVVAILVMFIVIVFASPLAGSLKDGVWKVITSFNYNNPAYYSQITLLNKDGTVISEETVPNSSEYVLPTTGGNTIWIRKSGNGEKNIDDSWNRELTFTVESSQTFQKVTGWEFGAENIKNAYAILYTDGELYIGGTGDTTGIPWQDFKAEIKEVRFSNTVAPTSMADWFRSECTNLTKVGKIPDSVLDMSYTFSYCEGLITAPELPANVQNLTYTFNRCVNLKTGPSKIPDSATTGYYTFYHCERMTNTPLITVNSSLTNMDHMFDYCKKMVEPPLLPRKATSVKYVVNYCNKLSGELDCWMENKTSSGTINTYYSLGILCGVNVTVNYTSYNADQIETWFVLNDDYDRWHKGVQLD